MTERTGYEIREGSKMLAERMPPENWLAVRDQTGEVYAIVATGREALRALDAADDYLAEAAACGHPRAPGWVAERTPLIIAVMTSAERAAALEEGTPILDREP